MLFIIKVTITPVLVALVSLAARYWGPTFGGLLMGLPWMTGPILFFFGIEHGDDFVAKASVGALAGNVGVGPFLLAFAAVARHGSWPLSFVAGSIAYIAVSSAMNIMNVSLWTAATVAAGTLVLCDVLMPRAEGRGGPRQLVWWDIPMRMLATAALVTLVSFTADILGPRLSGTVTTFPVIVTVVGSFTLARWGSSAAIQLSRNTVLPMLSFTAFFLVLGALVERWGLVPVFVMSAVAALIVSALVLTFNRWRAGR